MDADRTEIVTQYRDFVIRGKAGDNLHQFLTDANITEATFFHAFGSLKALRQATHQTAVKNTIERIEHDANYSDYSARERLLAFCFTWFEELLKERLYLLTIHNSKDLRLKLSYLKSIEAPIRSYLQELLSQAESSGEIPNRLFLNQTYPMAAWKTIKFILWVWLNDNSTNFSKTDAAIEKSVNLLFDLICRGPIESLLDFSRFLITLRDA